jgi:two-component system phosphate regulon sensor histidine kinase PhoR
VKETARRWAGSYRGRLVLGYAIVVAVFGVAWAWSLFGPLTNTIVQQQEKALTAIANAGAAIAQSSNVTPQQIATKLAETTGVRITIVGSDGTVLADSDENPAEMENHRNRPEIAAALVNRIGTDRRVSRTEGSEQLYVAVPAVFGGQRIAVRASERTARIEALVVRSRRLGLLLLTLALTIAAVIASSVSRSLAEPVQRLSDAARKMAAGDLGAEIPRPSGELGVLADSLVDLRRQMRARLDELEAEQSNMRSALDGLGDAVFQFHGDTIRFANRAASELFKAPVGGWRNHSLPSAGLPASLTARITELLPSPEPIAEELVPDPTGRSLRLSVVPLSPDDRGPRTLVVISDITERVQLDRVRKDFVANASHELKTPVAGIQLLAESAAHAAEDGDEEQALAFARQIAQESSRLQHLVRDLLDLSRVEGAARPEAVTDVRDAAHNALLGHQAAATARGLYLRFDDAAAAEDVFAVVDPTDLAVALDNLLANAVTYTETGGVSLELHADDHTVRVSVVDTGIGIPEEELPRVFERFYRVDPARARESGGTGLGLALVRHIAERSDGSVSVESTQGRGSRFTLALRRAR